MGELIYQIRWALPLWFVGLLTNWWPDNKITLRLRGGLARPFIGECGSGFELGTNVSLINAHNLRIGNNVYLAKGVWLNCLGGVTIEDEVVIAPYVVISSLQHVFKNGSVRFGGSISGPVRIGKGTWLSAHVAVKCGVTIGSGNLIAANACVVSNTPNNVIVGGVPAKIICENRDEEAQLHTRADWVNR